MAVGHPLTALSEGGDAYDYMDRYFHILSCTDRVGFLVQKQVEATKNTARIGRCNH